MEYYIVIKNMSYTLAYKDEWNILSGQKHFSTYSIIPLLGEKKTYWK